MLKSNKTLGVLSPHQTDSRGRKPRESHYLYTDFKYRVQDSISSTDSTTEGLPKRSVNLVPRFTGDQIPGLRPTQKPVQEECSFYAKVEWTPPNGDRGPLETTRREPGKDPASETERSLERGTDHLPTPKGHELSGPWEDGGWAYHCAGINYKIVDPKSKEQKPLILCPWDIEKWLFSCSLGLNIVSVL